MENKALFFMSFFSFSSTARSRISDEVLRQNFVLKQLSVITSKSIKLTNKKDLMFCHGQLFKCISINEFNDRKGGRRR